MRRAAVIACLCLAAGAAGCSSGQREERGEAQRGGSISVDLAGPVGNLDPALARTPEALRAAWLVYTAPLAYRRAEGREGLDIVPGIALRAPKVSEDGLTWKLTLRPQIIYSDGRPLHAADVERGIARSLRLDPAGALQRFGAITGAAGFARSKGAGADVPGITTDDPTGQVQIDLERPDPQLKYALASLQAAPVPRGTGIERPGRLPPGIGPFAVRRAGPRSFTLVRSRSFDLDGVPAASVDSVSGREVVGSRRRVRRVLGDRSDATEGEAPVSLLPSLRSEYGTSYSEARTLRVLVVALDGRRRPFSNPDIRQAVSYSLDERALGRIWAGLLDPACNLLPPQLPDYRRTEDCPFGEREGDSDLVRAQELVERAPVRRTRILVDGGEPGARGRALAGYLADRLDAIGLRARVARTAGERRRAQAVFGSRIARDPVPGPYLPAEQRLEAAATDPDDQPAWSRLDAEAVADGSLAPYGVALTGVLLSQRLDSANCRRIHPLYGLDYSSLCLR